MAEIYTHNETASLVDCFESLLERKGIVVPDDDRTGESSESCLYGVTYSDLLDEVELMVIDLLKRAESRARIKKFVFE